MQQIRKIATILMLAFALATPATVSFSKGKFVQKRPGEVYFLRGLANVFSLGLDTLSDEYKKYGVNSVVYNHKSWEKIGQNIIKRQRAGQISYPIIIIGHSLGAGAAPKLATMLGKQGIPVSYMVMLDAVEPLPVSNYVQQAINYYLPKKRGQNLVKPVGDFQGVFENDNVKGIAGMDHFNIDENEILRGKITKRVFELIEAQEKAMAK